MNAILGHYHSWHYWLLTLSKGDLLILMAVFGATISYVCFHISNCACLAPNYHALIWWNVDVLYCLDSCCCCCRLMVNPKVWLLAALIYVGSITCYIAVIIWWKVRLNNHDWWLSLSLVKIKRLRPLFISYIWLMESIIFASKKLRTLLCQYGDFYIFRCHAYAFKC